MSEQWPGGKMNAVDFTLQRLKIEEGECLDVYKDHLGYDTIGVGCLLPLSKEEQGLACLPARPKHISPMQSSALLGHRLGNTAAEVTYRWSWLKTRPPAVKAAIFDMAYQLGVPRLAKFRKMWGHLETSYYEEAAFEALDSRWAKQTPQRAHRNAYLLQWAGWLPPTVRELYETAQDWRESL